MHIPPSIWLTSLQIRFRTPAQFGLWRPMIGENRELVTDEPVEFEIEPVEVQDCREITDHFRGIYRIYPNLIKENRRMSTCNRLDLQTLGSQPLVSKNLPDHWWRLSQGRRDKADVHGCSQLFRVSRSRWNFRRLNEANTVSQSSEIMCDAYIIGLKWRLHPLL